jgi:hypothetical protein
VDEDALREIYGRFELRQLLRQLDGDKGDSPVEQVEAGGEPSTMRNSWRSIRKRRVSTTWKRNSSASRCLSKRARPLTSRWRMIIPAPRSSCRATKCCRSSRPGSRTRSKRKSATTLSTTPTSWRVTASGSRAWRSTRCSNPTY